MDGITLKVDATKLKARLARVKGAAVSSDTVKAGATAVLGLVRQHVSDVAQTNHKSARRLGAMPRGHYDPNKVTGPVITGSGKATVSVGIPGYARAYGPLDIRARAGGMLTIPLHASAYGRSTRELRATGVKMFRPKGTDILAMSAPKGSSRGFIALYALKPFVHQNQDASLMPTDTDVKRSFEEAVAAALGRSLGPNNA